MRLFFIWMYSRGENGILRQTLGSISSTWLRQTNKRRENVVVNIIVRQVREQSLDQRRCVFKSGESLKTAVWKRSRWLHKYITEVFYEHRDILYVERNVFARIVTNVSCCQIASCEERNLFKIDFSSGTEVPRSIII